MNYTKHYNALIAKAKTRVLFAYTEKHHIIPRCLGGNNSKDNLVSLTPEEHYVAHQLLVKMYPNNTSLVYALNMMTVSSDKCIRNNKKYGWIKRRHQEACKARVGALNPSFGKSWYYNPNTLQEGKFTIDSIPSDWVKGRKSTRQTHKVKPQKICSKCGELLCLRKDICRNTQRINRFISNFTFDKTVLGTSEFYKEYDRVVKLLTDEYVNNSMIVEELRLKYNISTNETMRRILISLDIKRRTLREATINYRHSLAGKT